MSALAGMADIAGGLLSTIGKIVLILIVAVGGFFGTKSLKKARAKKKNLQIRAFISNPDGSHYIDYIGKVKDNDGIDKMMFKLKKGDTCPVIPNKYIINNSVHLFRYGPSEFAIIPPEIYRNVSIEKFGIKLIPMNMLTFKGLEQRASITRWQTSKDKLQQWMPWITIIICVGLALGSIYLVGDMTTQAIDKAASERKAECSDIFSMEKLSTAIAGSLVELNKVNVISSTPTNNVNSTSPL